MAIGSDGGGGDHGCGIRRPALLAVDVLPPDALGVCGGDRVDLADLWSDPLGSGPSRGLGIEQPETKDKCHHAGENR